jgi:cysteine desulfurase/selenocysteine lyase
MPENEKYAMDFGPFAGRAWFNTAHQGPLPKVAVQAAEQAVQQRIRPSEIRDEDFFEESRRLREALGRFTGALPSDIILGNSTSYGLDLLANGIRWQAGDEILLIDGDFPANIYPWFILRERGVQIRRCTPRGVVLTACQLTNEIGPKTRLFCTSWVNSFTGYAVDIEALGAVCRNHQVIFVVNASQGLGARVLNLEHPQVDAVTCCGYKWLCGPYGTGFCWLIPALRESLAQQHAYWQPMQSGKPLDQMRDCSLRQDLGARAWDVFCPANFLNSLPWTASLEYLLAAGPEQISIYDQQIVDLILRGLDRDRFQLLSPEAGPERSTLIVIRPQNGLDAFYWRRQLAQAGIDVAVREGNLRIAPHLHNTSTEVESLLHALAS